MESLWQLVHLRLVRKWDGVNLTRQVPRSVKKRMIEIYKQVVEKKDFQDVLFEMLYFQDADFVDNNYRIDKEYKKLKEINFGLSKIKK